MQADPTPDAAINLLLEQLLSEVQKIFGKKLIGFYLFGSLVTGDFERGSSDIDLVAVTASDIDEQELEELQQMHRDFVDKKNKEWDDRIEVAYLSVTALKTFKVRATVAQRYSLRLVPGHPVEPQVLVTPRPRHGLPMTLHPREYERTHAHCGRGSECIEGILRNSMYIQ